MDRIRKIPESRIKLLRSIYLMNQRDYAMLSDESKNETLQSYFIKGVAEALVKKVLEFNKIKRERIIEGFLYTFQLEVIVPETPKNEDH